MQRSSVGPGWRLSYSAADGSNDLNILTHPYHLHIEGRVPRGGGDPPGNLGWSLVPAQAASGTAEGENWALTSFITLSGGSVES